jgi:hypothetical protein
MNLVLGLQGLPEAEASLVRTIVRLSSNLLTPWTVIDAGRCDAQLVDIAALDAGEAPGLQPGGVQIAVLGRGQPARPAALARPIRAEELIELLNDAAPRCLAGRSRLETEVAADTEAQAVRGRPVEAASPTVASTAPVRQAPCRAARLRRWPPHALLSGRPGYLQLASLLSRAPMSAQRLAALSSRRIEDCEAFLNDMDAQQLLAWEATPAVPQVATADALARKAPPPTRGFLGLLRRKLGIDRLVRP